MMDTVSPLTHNRKTCLIIHHAIHSLMDSHLMNSRLSGGLPIINRTADALLTRSKLADSHLMDNHLTDNHLTDSRLMDSRLTATVRTGWKQATAILPTNYPKTCLSKN